MNKASKPPRWWRYRITFAEGNHGTIPSRERIFNPLLWARRRFSADRVLAVEELSDSGEWVDSALLPTCAEEAKSNQRGTAAVPGGNSMTTIDHYLPPTTICFGKAQATLDPGSGTLTVTVGDETTKHQATDVLAETVGLGHPDAYFCAGWLCAATEYQRQIFLAHERGEIQVSAAGPAALLQ